LQTVAEEMMRPHSRYFDEHEHEVPWDYINFMHQAMRAVGAGSLAPSEGKNGGDKEGEEQKREQPSIGYQSLAFMLETLSWGDVGMYLVTPGGGLGAAAVEAISQAEKKFLNDSARISRVWCHGDDRPACGLGHLRSERRRCWTGLQRVGRTVKIFVTAGHNPSN
jgi:acyl-CoA dehydrogenase